MARTQEDLFRALLGGRNSGPAPNSVDPDSDDPFSGFDPRFGFPGLGPPDPGKDFRDPDRDFIIDKVPTNPRGNTPPPFDGFPFAGTSSSDPKLKNTNAKGKNKNNLGKALKDIIIPGLGIGGDTLLDLLLSQGATDPALLNRQLTDIERGTQGEQAALSRRAASSGFQPGTSGVLEALRGAQGAAGVESQSRAIERENRLQEERKRQDLGILLGFLDRFLSKKQIKALTRQSKNAGGGGGGGGFGDLLGLFATALSGTDFSGNKGGGTTGGTTGSTGSTGSTGGGGFGTAGF